MDETNQLLRWIGAELQAIQRNTKKAADLLVGLSFVVAGIAVGVAVIALT